jgi:hypothetical protein
VKKPEAEMFKRLAITFAAALLIGAAAVPAHADTRLSIHVGAPVARYPVYAARAPYPVYPSVAYAQSPYPGYVWQPERYVRTRYGVQVVPGAWVPAPYVAPRVYAPPVYAAPRLGIGFSFFSRGHRR